MEQQLEFPRPWVDTVRKQVKALRSFHILSAFFATDRSPDNRQVIDIQRRACWIGLALILQAINEGLNQIEPRWYAAHAPWIKPWVGTMAFCLILGSFFMMWMAFRPTTLRRQTRRVQRHPYLWQRVVLVLALITSLAGVIEFGRGVYLGFFAPPQYTNDGTSLDTNAAMELLQGHNPYADADIVKIARLFKIDPTWTTPLRVGQFANRLNYPTADELRTVLDTDNKSGSSIEFEARVSYPSLSFLTLVPFIWLGLYNVLPLYLLSYLALVMLGWRVVRREMRPWVVVFALANISMWSSVVGGNLDVIMILFIVMSWLWRDRRWVSALCLGLAIACKQPAWFFVPFYAVLILRTRGWREAISRLSVAGAVMLALNLPFFLWDPQAWLAGVMAPISDPMFPMGVGIVGLVGSPLIHNYMASLVYSVLEYLVFYPLCLVWYWRLCKTHPEAAMLLAVLPLFFAWRSLPSYFACAAFPMFILLASRGNSSRGSQPRNTPIIQGPAHGQPDEVVRQATEVARERELAALV
ncbi:MAG TPA: hypothetical protein VHD63_14065 [Ktedonobacteraceae bacterium]|nr:hypothetical protein [Ktedonobacteraceae bacterium]